MLRERFQGSGQAEPFGEVRADVGDRCNAEARSLAHPFAHSRFLHRRYGCVEHTPEAMGVIASVCSRCSGLVEMGAGNGQWSRVLRSPPYSCDVLSFDDMSALPLNPSLYHNRTEPNNKYVKKKSSYKWQRSAQESNILNLDQNQKMKSKIFDKKLLIFTEMFYYRFCRFSQKPQFL